MDKFSGLQERVSSTENGIASDYSGAGTAIADSPSLTVRLGKKSIRQPLRVLLDAKGKVKPEGPYSIRS